MYKETNTKLKQYYICDTGFKYLVQLFSNLQEVCSVPLSIPVITQSRSWLVT